MSAAIPSRRPTSTTRVRLAEPREQAGNVEVPGGHERSDPDPPPEHAAQLVDLRAGGVHLREHTPGARGDRLARLGGDHAAAACAEQRRSQLGFEPPYLVRQRRLSEMEFLRGAREVTVPRHRLDASQLPQLHTNERRPRSLR